MDKYNIGYDFKNEELIKTAFTHSSLAYERNNKFASNERLEYLGDAVLEPVISEYIFENYEELTEGEMTKVRASVVCEKSLCKIAERSNFSDFLQVGKCEKNENKSQAMLADSVEAVIGAIYVDAGYEPAKKYILDNLQAFVAESVLGLGVKDYKTTLQEELQRNPNCKIEYVVEKEEGPEHAKMFYVNMLYNGEVYGKGFGTTKKEAEQQAAKEALEKMENE